VWPVQKKLSVQPGTTTEQVCVEFNLCASRRVTFNVIKLLSLVWLKVKVDTLVLEDPCTKPGKSMQFEPGGARSCRLSIPQLFVGATIRLTGVGSLLASCICTVLDPKAGFLLGSSALAAAALARPLPRPSRKVTVWSVALPPPLVWYLLPGALFSPPLLLAP